VDVGIAKQLCVFCVACVGVCVVDDCIQVSRKRPNGELERFSNAREVLTLLRSINSRKAVEKTKSRFPDAEAYLERCGHLSTFRDAVDNKENREPIISLCQFSREKRSKESFIGWLPCPFSEANQNFWSCLQFIITDTGITASPLNDTTVC